MSSDPLISELLSRWESAQRGGQPLSPEDLCRDCPDRLPELRSRLSALAAVDLLLCEGGRKSGEPEELYVHEGRYRPVQPHARGGLGEVLVAEDKELHRPVALKRIQEHRADDPESRRRFLREAEITAKLQHPGIVPIYGLTRDQRGRLS